ncbi:hypothetical protein Ocin01_15281 [Orchesella cincta]|uniref:Uncharacterized protein n=1 Tax=Orchesella cincta TaxID=48709 RepID=A0A1D2MEX3_ORCCI|nr:hypothetical protein Ocin01_15281 [Orchesella cincta]
MASGDHARKQQLQAGDELPLGKEEETPEMEGGPTHLIDLEDKMNIMNLDEKNLAGELKQEGDAQALDSVATPAQKADEGSPAQTSKEMALGTGPAREKAYKEEFENIRNLIIDCGEPISFEGLKTMMARLKVGQAVQIESGMETGKLLEELDGIQLDYIRSIVRLNHFLNGVVDVGRITLFQMAEDQHSDDQPENDDDPKVTIPDLRKFARKDRPELVRRLYTELATIKGGAREIRRRIEKVDEAVVTSCS